MFFSAAGYEPFASTSEDGESIFESRMRQWNLKRAAANGSSRVESSRVCRLSLFFVFVSVSFLLRYNKCSYLRRYNMYSYV